MPRPRVLVNALSMSEGGGRSYVLNVVRELARDDRGFEFTLLVQREQLSQIDAGPIPVRAVRLPARGRTAFRVAYEELVLPLLAARFDLLYCIADMVPRYAAAPAVVLSCNLNVYDHRWYDDARLRMLERLARFGLPNARRVVFPSRAAADFISERVRLPADRIRVVHFGVALEAFAVPSAIERPGARFLFLPAAPEKHKNIEVLIDGLALAADRDLELWIAGRSLGDPGHRSVLERRAKAAGVGARVRFIGAIPYAQLAGYYRHAGALAFPSHIETFGLPLLEAMALGTPVLASDIPTFREIAGDAARYFSPGDPAAVADVLDSLRSDPEGVQRRIDLGRARAAQFTWRASVDALCTVFSEVLERP